MILTEAIKQNRYINNGERDAFILLVISDETPGLDTISPSVPGAN
jgi:hypothetical protein